MPERSVGRETGGHDCNATFDRREREPRDVVVYRSSATRLRVRDDLDDAQLASHKPTLMKNSRMMLTMHTLETIQSCAFELE